MASSQDYDVPRTAKDADESLEALKASVPVVVSGIADVDAADGVEGFELPGAEQIDEELTAAVPMQAMSSVASVVSWFATKVN